MNLNTKEEMKDRIKYLKAENKWLWYYHNYIQDDTCFMETIEYNKRGEIIATTESYYPAKRHRPKHPKEKL